MKNNSLNKTLKAKTGKDIFTLMGSKDKGPQQDIAAPTSETEIALSNIWQSLLGHNRFSIHDDFFHVGGNSLKAVQAVSRICRHFSIQIDLTDIFLQPTIAKLAVLINSKSETNQAAIIPVNPKPSHIPLSFSQERLWFIDQLEGSIPYHLPVVLSLQGDLNKGALSHALKTVVGRHQALRTVFSEHDGQPFQQVKDEKDWKIDCDESLKVDRQQLQIYIQQLVNQPFDLSTDFMLRAHLISLHEREHILVVTMHHIASDGWSMSIIVREVLELYKAFSENCPAQLLILNIQYADYAIWQRSQLQSEILNNKVSYWREKLTGVEPLQLPADYKRPVVQSTKGSAIDVDINEVLFLGLEELSRQQGVTMFMTLLSAFKVLLHRYSSQTDICVGTPVANRNQQEVEGLIGYFVNTLALRSTVDNDSTFVELLQQLKKTTIDAYAHQDVPFEKVVEAVGVERDLSRNPLFQVMFVLQNTPEIPEFNIKNLHFSEEKIVNHTAKFDITFTLTEADNSFKGFVEYCTDLYSNATISRMIGHFNHLLTSIVAAPRQKIGLLQMVSTEEVQQILKDFNHPKLTYPSDKTVVSLFEDQAGKVPGATALVFNDQQLTYKELNERSNQLAYYLQSKEVQAETLVPICVEQSIEMIVGILGILKAGAAYVPIDPGYPAERIQFLLQDTQAKVVVSNHSCGMKLPGLAGVQIIETDTDAEIIRSQPAANLSITISADYPAYVIYTSGSTGKPKGVVIEHSSLINYLLNGKADYINKDSGQTGTFIHLSYTFDASLTAIFMPLLSGKAMVISSKQSLEVFEDPNLAKWAPYD
ncbi:MAG: condensation domain-containing protein, partial [Bacteroidota bacterium]|nr:condensation domain-containing protein [Bacteroidota bacterium]